MKNHLYSFEAKLSILEFLHIINQLITKSAYIKTVFFLPAPHCEHTTFQDEYGLLKWWQKTTTPRRQK